MMRLVTTFGGWGITQRMHTHQSITVTKKLSSLRVQAYLQGMKATQTKQTQAVKTVHPLNSGLNQTESGWFREESAWSCSTSLPRNIGSSNGSLGGWSLYQKSEGTLVSRCRTIHSSGRSEGTLVSRCRTIHSSGRKEIEENHHTKSVTVWSNLRQVTSSPLPALTLGLAGLIPFVAAPACMITSSVYMGDVAFAQVAYGASILSFLGGVRWGFVLPEENPIQPNWVNLAYSVTPALVAWTGLLLPPTGSLLTVATGLALAAYGDMAMFGYPAWYKGMRFLLSFVAVLALWSTFMCSLMLNSEKSKSESASQEVE